MGANVWTDGAGDGAWSSTGNWSLGTVPVAGDDVTIQSSARQIVTGITSVHFNSLTVLPGFTGTLGSLTTALTLNSSSSSPCPITINAPFSGNININAGSNPIAVNVIASGQSLNQGFESVRFAGTSSSNTITVNGGITGGATSTPADSFNVSGGVTVNSQAQLNLAAGATWVAATVATGGTFNVATGGTTLTVSPGGTATINGTTKVGTINVGGRVYANARPGSGNIADVVNLYATGTIDCSGNTGTGTFGALNQYKGGRWIDSPSVPNHVTVAPSVIRSGTAQAGAGTTITLDSGASGSNGFYNGDQIFIWSGTGAGQNAIIASYVGSTKVATIQGTWGTNPDNTSVFVILSLATWNRINGGTASIS